MSFFKDLVVADWSQHSTLLHSDPVPHVDAEYEQSRSCFGLKNIAKNAFGNDFWISL